MEEFTLGENILRFRNRKKMTQEELAVQVGVTKAAVSKWEKGQSLPDIILLPRLAALLDMSIDALLGYEPGLSEAQIRRLCEGFAREMTPAHFGKVFEEIRESARRYYNVYPYLLRLSTFMIGRYEYAGDEEAQREVLNEIRGWCDHIIRDCREPRLIQNALALFTLTEYCLGYYEKVIETLSRYDSLIGMSNSNDLLLIRSYIMLREMDKAEKYAGLLRDKSILNLMEGGIFLLKVKKEDRKACEEILRKTDLLIETEELNEIHPYEVMQYQLMAAVYYAGQEETENMYERLELYTRIGERLLRGDGYVMDTYMKRIREWMDDWEPSPEYDPKGLCESMLEPLRSEGFRQYQAEKRFAALLGRIREADGRQRPR